VELLGEIERTFATAIYPNRTLVAAIAVAALLVLAALAWRGRWDRAIRRRPARSAAAIVLALVVIVPVGWYLGSPLVLSTTIDEPAPVASPTPGASIAPPSGGGPDERSGAFRGADEFHFGEGTARLIEVASGRYVIRLEDFAVRNGPDLYVFVSPSPDGYTTASVELGRLKADRGNQNYEIPAGTDVAGARSVVIWCKQFAVEFAIAELMG